MSINRLDGPVLKPLFKFLQKTRLNAYVTLLVKRVLERFMANNFKFTDLNMVAVGQSHLDAAWRWRRKQGILKARATFKKALDHIDALPEFTFAQPSPAYYAWMQRYFPDIFRRIKTAVARGRWIPIGGSWVEPDTNVPCGESLVRQRLYGMHFYLREFGKLPDVEFLQDCFGFNRNLPQIFAKSGARLFGTGKVPFWNTTNSQRFPFGMCRWRSPDGTVLPTVLIHFGYFLPINYGKRFPHFYLLGKEGATLEADYGTPPEDFAAFRSDELMRDAIFGYGLGDGGHGPIEAEIAVVRAFRTLFPKHFKFFQEHDFYYLFKKHFPRWLTWTDELYLEAHRGTYTTHAHVKRCNRENEVRLETLEKLQTLTALIGRPCPHAELTRHWKLLLFNQFHDILPGSSIPEVYQDAYQDYARLHAYTERALAANLSFLGRHLPRAGNRGTPVLVFNPLSWRRAALVELDLPAGASSGTVETAGGESLAVQPVVPALAGLERAERPHWIPPGTSGDAQAGPDAPRKLLVRVPAVPPVGARVLYLSPGGDSAWPDALSRVKTSQREDAIVLDNGRLEVAIALADGLVSRLHDKHLDHAVLTPGSARPRLFRELQKTDAWDIDPEYPDHPVSLPAPASVTLVEQGPLRATVRVQWEVDETRVTQDYSLVAGHAHLAIGLHVDWHHTNTIFKLALSPAVDPGARNAVSCEIPYAFIDRPVTPRTYLDEARWEWSGQKWIDVSDGTLGVTVMSRDKYGFNWADGELRLTVLRGPKFPGCAKETMFVDEADPRRPAYTDQHFHAGIAYGVFLHEGTWREGAWRPAYEFNYPLVTRTLAPHPETAEQAAQLEFPVALVSVDAPNVRVVVAKLPEPDPTGNGRDDASPSAGTPVQARVLGAGGREVPIIVRIVEHEGRETPVRLAFPPWVHVRAVAEVDLLELNPRFLADAARDHAVCVTLSPHEIKTLRVTLAGATGAGDQEVESRGPV